MRGESTPPGGAPCHQRRLFEETALTAAHPAPPPHTRPAPPAADPALDLHVRAEAIRENYAHMPPALYSTAGGSAFVAYTLSEVTPAALWGPWLALMYLQLALRLALLLAYQRRQPDDLEIGRWGRLSAAGAVVSGVLWGAALAVLPPPEPVTYTYFIVLVTAVLATTAGVTSAAHLPSLFGFYLPVMVPLPYFLLIRHEPLSDAIGTMFLVYLPIYVRFILRVHRSVIRAIRLRVERGRMVEELARRSAAAEAATLEKSRFLAAASHDLRQPMHALVLFVESLKEEVTTPAQERLLKRIAQSVTAMDGLFHALLDISRLDSGTVRPQPEAFPVQRLLDGAVLAFAGLADARGLRLAVVPSRAWVEADPALCEQVLHNLVSNALRHTRGGGVVVGCRRRGERLELMVADTGPGIREEDREAIFREFVQLDNPGRDREKGLGLGLAIVRRLAELMGLPLRLRTVPGRGSCFSIGLPRVAAQSTTARPAPEATDDPLPGACIAVVEDDLRVREATVELLQRWGMRPVAAADAASLIAALDAEPSTPVPDLILSDYRLADAAGGIGAVQRLRDEYNREIPALLVSGDIEPQRLREAEESGLPLLHKPVAPRRLRATLAALVRRPDVAVRLDD